MTTATQPLDPRFYQLLIRAFKTREMSDYEVDEMVVTEIVEELITEGFHFLSPPPGTSKKPRARFLSRWAPGRRIVFQSASDYERIVDEANRMRRPMLSHRPAGGTRRLRELMDRRRSDSAQRKYSH